MTKIIVGFKHKKIELDVEQFANVEVIKKFIKLKEGLPEIQQRLEIRKEGVKIILKDTDSVQDILEHFENETPLIFCKNLGRQIGYRNLFYLEYAGPFFLWIFFLFYYLDRINSYYILVTSLCVIHFGKRLLESKYVHIFSHASIPWTNAWRNILIYWFLHGTLIPLEIYYRDLELGPCWFPCRFSEIVMTLIFLTCEYFNFYCHWELRKLRIKKDQGKEVIDKKMHIPKGMFFDQIVSPNYTFEILLWIVFVFISGSVVSALFIALGGFIMYKWAKKRKVRILNSDDYSERDKLLVKKRDLLFPGLL